MRIDGHRTQADSDGMKIGRGIHALCAAWMATGALLGCGDDQPGENDPSRSCAGLAGMRLTAAQIGLPTSGANVVSAVEVPARTDGQVTEPAHCFVSAEVFPVDPKAPPILLAVALPTPWNEKALWLGGGGFDGVIPDVTGNSLNALAPAPLARGYAVFASDGGHQSTAASPGADASALVNEEAYRNWLSDAPKKVRDVAGQIIRAYYGIDAARFYAVGSSTGGREALFAAARSPADWDGALVLYPARNVTNVMLGLTAMLEALSAPGAFPDAAKRKLVWEAVLAECDALDGLADGVVGDVVRCNEQFDVTALRCEGGADAGDACLSDAQIQAFEAIDAPVRLASPLASGDTELAGYNVYSAAQGVGTDSPLEPHVQAVDLGSRAPSFPVDPLTNSFAAALVDSFMRHVVVGDQSFDYRTFDARTFGPYAARVQQLSALDVGDAELGGFAARGGKLLLLHGTGDMLTSPRTTERYVEALQASLGAGATDAMLRYYEVPGFQHAASTVFHVSWDGLGALERWVETGKDPGDDEVVTDLAGVPGRTRPLCRYPTFARYRGTGDPNDAASFECAAP
ncbi:feruloyl esterase [Sorangium cellulosum]|uniref:Feruloyl esterase n=2 Tax=Polyangiaceae TaxID=49 RepID=A0A4P2QKW8_SORCE|nr:feruloyl esterase [Sorangium cellulosum]WCQ90068.1 Mono(2-hydroxyethyl) terephthalate hydrolase [Sorangium sp. Soce836]